MRYVFSRSGLWAGYSRVRLVQGMEKCFSAAYGRARAANVHINTIFLGLKFIDGSERICLPEPEKINFASKKKKKEKK